MGGWSQNALKNYYLLKLSPSAMRTMAGFGSEAGNFFLKRASIPVPDSLQRAVFPWVDDWVDRYAKAFGSGKASFAEGGMDHPDIAGKNFLEVLRFFRIVVLQDSAVLQADFPRNPLWTAQVFSHPEWRSFADAVLVAHRVQDAPLDVRIKETVPVVAEAMTSFREELSTLVASESNQTREMLSTVEKRLKNHASSCYHDLHRAQDWAWERPAYVTVHRSKLPAPSLDALDQHRELPELTPRRPPSSAVGVSLLPSPPETDPQTIQGPTFRSCASFSPEGTPLPPGGRRDVSLTAEGWPSEPFSLNVKHVRDAWREWHQGLSPGSPAIVDLDKKFGAKWRYSQAIRQRHYRRKFLIGAMEARLARGMTEEDAIEEIAEFGVGKTLNAVQNGIRNGTFK